MTGFFSQKESLDTDLPDIPRLGVIPCIAKRKEEEEANGPKTRERLKTVASRHRNLSLDVYVCCTHLALGHKTPQMMTHPQKEAFFCLDNILNFVFVLYAFVILTPRSPDSETLVVSLPLLLFVPSQKSEEANSVFGNEVYAGP